MVNLGKRVKNLEERLNEAEKAAARVGSVGKAMAELPPRAVEPVKESPMMRAKEKAREESVVSESMKASASPPPLPVPMSWPIPDWFRSVGGAWRW